MSNGNINGGDFRQHIRWQIPRASLSSGSRSIHSSTDSIQRTFDNHYRNKNQRRRESYSTGSEQNRKNSLAIAERIDEGPYSMPTQSLSSASLSNYSSSSLPPLHHHNNHRDLKHQQLMKKLNRQKLTENLDEIVVNAAVVEERVHGSTSSQGSSSNSLHSASSLLLSVQNLEKFTRMTSNGGNMVSKAHMILNMNDNCNYDDVEDAASKQQQQKHYHNNNNKAKDIDQMSIASSTHFTLVNGCGRANLKSTNSFCRHGRQITILIVTMTLVFTIGILGILYLMDRRAKSMPAYHQ